MFEAKVGNTMNPIPAQEYLTDFQQRLGLQLDKAREDGTVIWAFNGYGSMQSLHDRIGIALRGLDNGDNIGAIDILKTAAYNNASIGIKKREMRRECYEDILRARGALQAVGASHHDLMEVDEYVKDLKRELPQQR